MASNKNTRIESIDFIRGVAVLGIFVLIIWIIQLIWSKYWMSRFNQGPLEFIWRKITYLGKN